MEDIAAHLKVAKESIYRWADAKGFPAQWVRCPLRFKLSEVDEWVQARGGDDSAYALAKTPEARPKGRKPNVKKKSGHG